MMATTPHPTEDSTSMRRTHSAPLSAFWQPLRTDGASNRTRAGRGGRPSRARLHAREPPPRRRAPAGCGVAPWPRLSCAGRRLFSSPLAVSPIVFERVAPQLPPSPPAAQNPRKDPSAFFVVVNGQVESGEFPDDDLYIRYGFSFGPDWTVVDGIETGLSQIARKAAGVDQSVVWNFPIDVSFKSTNAHGWPRMSISVYGVDSLGRDVVRGYGSVLIPPSPPFARVPPRRGARGDAPPARAGTPAPTTGTSTPTCPCRRRSGSASSAGSRARTRGRKRVIQRRFDVGVLEAGPERNASTL